MIHKHSKPREWLAFLVRKQQATFRRKMGIRTYPVATCAVLNYRQQRKRKPEVALSSELREIERLEQLKADQFDDYRLERWVKVGESFKASN